MSESSPDAPWNLFGSLLTEYSSVVHWISLVCFGLGLMLFVPIILFIIFDLVVWAWRTASNSSPTSPRDSKPTVVASNTNTSAIATGIDKATLRC